MRPQSGPRIPGRCGRDPRKRYRVRVPCRRRARLHVRDLPIPFRGRTLGFATPLVGGLRGWQRVAYDKPGRGVVYGVGVGKER